MLPKKTAENIAEMDIMKKIIIITFLSLLIGSCKDNSIEKNYELDVNSNNEIQLINKQKSGNGYDVISISGHILFYGHSKDYIIAIQKPLDSIYNSNENLKYDEMMKKVFESNFNQFWILKVKNDSLFGPYQKSEYLKIREKIGVPANFKIDHSTLADFYNNSDYRKDIQYKNPDKEVVDTENLN